MSQQIDFKKKTKGPQISSGGQGLVTLCLMETVECNLSYQTSQEFFLRNYNE